MLVYTSSSALETIQSKSKDPLAIVEENNETPPQQHQGSSRKVSKKPINKFFPPMDDGPLPQYLKAFISQDRQLLEEDLREQSLLKQSKIKELASLKSRMKSLYLRLPYDEQFQFLPMDWLARFFANPTSVANIDLASITCVHGNLDLNRIQDVKAVSVAVADDLFREAMTNTKTSYGRKPPKRMSEASLCETCVRNRCRSIKLARSIHADHKILGDLMKSQSSSSDPCGSSQADVTNNSSSSDSPSDDSSQQFWIGKITLKRWRVYARESLEEDMRQEDKQHFKEQHQPRISIAEVQSKLSKVGTDVIISKAKQQQKQQNGDGGAAQNGDSKHHHNGNAEDQNKQQPPTILSEHFNSDMVCPHGNMCIQESRRRLVTKVVWSRLKKYFIQSKDFVKATPLCHLCVANDDKVKLATEAKKEVANNQKTLLNDMLNERNRPSWSRISLNKVYLLPRV